MRRPPRQAARLDVQSRKPAGWAGKGTGKASAFPVFVCFGSASTQKPLGGGVLPMAQLGLVLQMVILAYLVLVEPYYGRRLYSKLVGSADSDPRARTRFYGRIVRTEWGLSALALLSLWMRRQPLAAIGLRTLTGANPLVEGAIVGAVAGAVLGLGLSVMLAAVSARFRASMGKQLSSLQAMMPATAREHWQFAVVAVTAGICEETLFRGFMGMTFSELFPGAPLWVTVAVLAVVFGFAHWYQGWRGVLTTGAIGAALAVLYLAANSLWPGMLLHALIDLRVLGLVLVIDRSKLRDAAA